jgi:hypothetical protein
MDLVECVTDLPHPTAFPILLGLIGWLVLLISAVTMSRARVRKILTSETGGA